jgi:hypothetical protein
VKVLVLIAGLVLAPAASAPAATLAWASNGAVYAASAGEANRITARRDATRLVIHDAGAQIFLTSEARAAGCTLAGEHDAQCPAGGAAAIQTIDGDDEVIAEDVIVLLGIGDDRGVLVAPASSVARLDGEEGDDELEGRHVNGGDGNDRITVNGGFGSADGGGGDDVVTGGDADDQLLGGAGRDALFGGGGDDHLYEGARDEAAPDRYDGGPGFDEVDYVDRATPLRIDLSAGAGGAEGEGDSLAGIEKARGGGGPDVLVGGAGPDVLDGGGGDNVVQGAGGDDVLAGGSGDARVDGGAGADVLRGGADDVLDGGPGPDVLDGGYGADTLRGGDGDDRVTGGPGVDLLDGGAGADVLHAERDLIRDALDCGDGADSAVADVGDTIIGCEAQQTVSVPWPRFLVRPVAEVRGRWARMVVDCTAVNAALAGLRLRIRVGGRAAGSHFASCQDPRTISPVARDIVLVPLRAWARRLARRRGGVRARVDFDVMATFAGPAPGAFAIAQRIRLVP